MRFVIIGAGDVGITLSHRLAAHRHDVVLIEQSEEAVAKLGAEHDFQVIIGDGCSPDVQLAAGLENANYIVAVTDVDAVNIAACVIAKMVNPKARRIVRVRDISFDVPEITRVELAEHFDLIINPSFTAADHMLGLFEVPGAKEVVSFASGKLRVVGLTITPECPVINLGLSELRKLYPNSPTLIIAIVRGNRLIVPGGADKLRVGDIIYSITKPTEIETLFEVAGRHIVGGRSAMVWGGTSLGKNLALLLEERGIPVKLIVANPEEVSDVVDRLKRTLILIGSGTDQNLLTEEHIADTDAFLAVSETEEDNILAALLAKRLGAKVSMAHVNKADYMPLVSAIGVDVVVSSRLSAASAIFQHIHAKSIVSEFSLPDHEAGFLEVIAASNMEIIDKPLAELSLPYGIIVGAIVRGEEVIIPTGNSVIQAGDQVVIFVIRSAVKALEKLLNMNLELYG